MRKIARFEVAGPPVIIATTRHRVPGRRVVLSTGYRPVTVDGVAWWAGYLKCAIFREKESMTRIEVTENHVQPVVDDPADAIEMAAMIAACYVGAGCRMGDLDGVNEPGKG